MGVFQNWIVDSVYQEDVNSNFSYDLTIKKLLDHTKKIHNRSELCGKCIDDQIIAKYKKKQKSVVFKRNEKLSVRLRSKGGKGALNRRFVAKGKVIKKSERAENYKVSLGRPGENTQTKL